MTGDITVIMRFTLLDGSSATVTGQHESIHGAKIIALERMLKKRFPDMDEDNLDAWPWEFDDFESPDGFLDGIADEGVEYDD